MAAVVTMTAATAQRLLDAFWCGQFETRHAAENSVCAYDCDDSWSDFVAHKPGCEFVKQWAALTDVRLMVGDDREPRCAP